jgi:hypothetical protein
MEANLPLVLATFNAASLPTPSPSGQVIYVSDAASGAIIAFSDGANWRRCDTSAIVT